MSEQLHDAEAPGQSAGLPERIQVRDRWSIALHWFNAGCWLVLVLTGLGVSTGDSWRLVPAFWPEAMQGLVGGNQQLINLHAAVGGVWIAGIATYASLRWRSHVVPFLREVLVVTPRDLARSLWITAVILGQLLGFFRHVALPPTYRLNAAQRLLGTTVVLGSVAIALSGVYLFLAPHLLNFADSDLYGALYRASVLLHGAAVYLILTALIAHVYFSTVEQRPALEGMRSGYLSLEFLRRERSLWYDEIVRRYRYGERGDDATRRE